MKAVQMDTMCSLENAHLSQQHQDAKWALILERLGGSHLTGKATPSCELLFSFAATSSMEIEQTAWLWGGEFALSVAGS